MKETLNRIDSFLKNEYTRKRILGQNENLFFNVFEKIKENIDQLNNNNTVGYYDTNDIKKTIDYLRAVAIERPITKEYAAFAKDWCALVFNWNNNFAKIQKLGNDCNFVTRIIEQTLTMVEATELMKNMLQKMRQYESWQPPAFEISKHTLEYLK